MKKEEILVLWGKQQSALSKFLEAQATLSRAIYQARGATMPGLDLVDRLTEYEKTLTEMAKNIETATGSLISEKEWLEAEGNNQGAGL